MHHARLVCLCSGGIGILRANAGARYETKLPRAWLVKNQVDKPTPKKSYPQDGSDLFVFVQYWLVQQATNIDQMWSWAIFWGYCCQVCRQVAVECCSLHSLGCAASVEHGCETRGRCWSCTLPDQQNVDFEWFWNINFAFDKLAAILSWHLFHRLIFQNLEPAVLPKGQKQKKCTLWIPPLI